MAGGSRRTLLLVLLASPASAWGEVRGEIQAEYFWPVDDHRQIHTASLHALVGDELFGATWLGWRAGAALGYADGHIRQLDDALREVRLDNRAVSLGPMGALRLQTPPVHGASVGASASLATLLYTHRFPAGGDHYNFALRVGPFLELRVADVWIAVSYQLMHVSNGQGLGPHNPSYDAAGLGVWLSRAW